MSNKKRILVVDDDHFVRATLKKFLLTEGYDITGVRSGEAALESLENEEYDLILLDLTLTGISGIETLEKLRQFNSEIPVILISGYLTVEHIAEAAAFSIFSYIRKPFNIDDVRHKIKRAIF
jgi:DNA-binding NtrC family response regulator